VQGRTGGDTTKKISVVFLYFWGSDSRLRRSDRLMKKHRVSHPDEEDPGAICALLGAMKLNVWGGEESYSVSLEQEEGKSGGKGRAKRARKRRVRIS